MKKYKSKITKAPYWLQIKNAVETHIEKHLFEKEEQWIVKNRKKL